MAKKRLRERLRKRKRTYYSPLVPPSEHCGPENTAILDEEILIEATVNVSPEVTIGKVEIESLDCSWDFYEPTCSCSDECSYLISQLVRVKIPVRFGAKAEVDSCGVNCSHIGPCC